MYFILQINQYLRFKDQYIIKYTTEKYLVENIQKVAIAEIAIGCPVLCIIIFTLKTIQTMSSLAINITLINQQIHTNAHIFISFLNIHN